MHADFCSTSNISVDFIRLFHCINFIKMFGSGWAGSAQCADPLESPREGREERRIEEGREVTLTHQDLWQVAAAALTTVWRGTERFTFTYSLTFLVADLRLLVIVSVYLLCCCGVSCSLTWLLYTGSDGRQCGNCRDLEEFDATRCLVVGLIYLSWGQILTTRIVKGCALFSFNCKHHLLTVLVSRTYVVL